MTLYSALSLLSVAVGEMLLVVLVEGIVDIKALLSLALLDKVTMVVQIPARERTVQALAAVVLVRQDKLMAQVVVLPTSTQVMEVMV
jgi:hypothetical protein